jgi:hypothetical protein
VLHVRDGWVIQIGWRSNDHTITTHIGLDLHWLSEVQLARLNNECGLSSMDGFDRTGFDPNKDIYFSYVLKFVA